MMMDMENIQIAKLLRELLLILKENIWRLKVTGRERKFHNIKAKKSVQVATDID